MVHGEKLAKETLLPSVLEDDDAERESEKLQLGEEGSGPSSQVCKLLSKESVSNQISSLRGITTSSSAIPGPAESRESRTDVDRRPSPGGRVLDGGEGEGEEEEEEEEEEEGGKEEEGNEKEELQGEECVISDDDYDTDLEPGEEEEEEEGGGLAAAGYVEACERSRVVPASHFLQHMHDSELSMMHRGLGPQGTKALAVPLVTNTSILRLNLRDNWMEGMGGAAIAQMLKENCYITELDLSDNKLGDYGARAIAGMLKENSTLVSLNLSGNHFTDQSAEDFGPALITNTKLQHLDLSYNALGERAGQNLGHCLPENTGLRSLNLAWNCIQGRGAVMFANGLRVSHSRRDTGGHSFSFPVFMTTVVKGALIRQGNISLRTVDLSFNGFGKAGAIALGEALKENNILEKLNVSNNRIPPEGAIRLAMGLKVNKTIKSLNMGRNPIQNAGCYGILKSVQENPDSAMEALDFWDITVNQDFEDLYTAVKEIFPALTVNHGGRVGAFRKAKA